jgi:hypothetical protein
MTGRSRAEDAPHAFGDEGRDERREPLGELELLERRELLSWVGEHLPEVRRTASGERPVYWILGLAFVLGLVAHVGGYELRTSTSGEPLGLIAELLYALGFALWTGVVVTLFVQIFPEAKRRQYKAALDAYEAARRTEEGAMSDEAPPPDAP